MPLRSYWTLASACKYANLHKYNSTLTRCSTQPFRRKKYQQRNKLAPQIIASTAHCGSKICGCAVKSATCREARKQLKLINRPATKVCVANIKKGDAVRRELNIYCLGTICSPLLKRFHSISLQCGIRPQKCLWKDVAPLGGIHHWLTCLQWCLLDPCAHPHPFKRMHPMRSIFSWKAEKNKTGSFFTGSNFIPIQISNLLHFFVSMIHLKLS